MATTTIDFLTALKADPAAALDLIKLNDTVISALANPATQASGVITIPGYGTYTVATGAFKADAALTGTLVLTKGSGVGDMVPATVDLSSATGDITYVAAAEITKITGGTGSDTITGNTLTTDITGGEGNDSIEAKADTATVTGGAGNDVLTATGDNDTLTGGDGADVFSVNTAKATTVTDYKYAQGDSLVLNSGIANAVLGNTGLFNEKAAAPKLAVTTEVGTDNVYKIKVIDTATTTTKEFWTAKKDTAAVTLDASALNVAGVINTGAATAAVVKGSAQGDSIILTGSKATLQAGTAAGDDTITGFDGGFSGDVLNLTDVALMDVKWGATSGNTKIGSSTISGAGVAADAGKILVQVGTGTAQKVSFVGKAGAVTIDGTDSDVYMGKDDGLTVLDVSNTTVAATAINLSDTAKYKNISKVKGATYVAGTYIGTKNAADATVGTDFDLKTATKASQVWGGTAAADTIQLNATNAVKDTVWFGTTDGTDTVSGFTGGFADTSDVVNLYNVADLSKLTFAQGAGATDVSITASSGNTIEVQGAGALNAAKLLLQNSAGVVKKVAVGTAGTKSIDGVGADMVIGFATKDDIVAYGAKQTADLVANLQDASVYKNIKDVDLSNIASAYNVVVGSATLASNIVLAGAKTDVWGGSKETNVIKVGAGADTIWFGAGDGTDVIGGAGNTFDVVSDKIKIYDKTIAQIASGYKYTNGPSSVLTSNMTTANTLTLTNITGAQTINVIDKDGKEVKAAVGAAALDYNRDAKLYMGAAATVTVTGNDDVVLYLGNGVNGTVNDIYFSGVTGIDASAGTGQTVLIGSAVGVDTLKGGTTSSAMWGGGAAADIMQANAGVDQFWFGNGDGADTVTSASATDGVDKKDTIVLHNITSIADVTMTLDNAGNFVIGTKDGSTLTVTDNITSNFSALDGGLTFQFGVNADAKNYTYNRISKSFVAK